MGCVLTVTAIISCNRPRRGTGRAYMPDMTYSVAYETYGETESRLKKSDAHYNGRPVDGTIARGDMFPYIHKNDSLGYVQSATVTNPVPPLDERRMVEATRLYLINCAICHGDKLDGNGPLFKGGDGPYKAAPKNFLIDEMKAMTEGTMFHSITYGKNMMGSYASQLSPEQRWMIIHYIRDKQKGPAAGGAKTPADSINAGQKPVDSTGMGNTAAPK